jgi:hypothetical protein
MKNFTITGVIAVIAVAFTFAACNKYEDGPKLSLRTKKARLSNEWTIDKVYLNDVDQTAAYLQNFGNDYVLEIEKDGKYFIDSAGVEQDNGTWELGEDKDDVRFKSSVTGSQEISYRILRLKEKELWLRYTYANGDVEKVYYKEK